jgi:hypothetical protein
VQGIDNTKLGQTEFRAEGVTVTPIQKIAVRKLLTDAGCAVKANEETLALPNYLNQMTNLAEAAGGASPLPATPDTSHLDALKTLRGNELLLAVSEQKDRLAKEFTEWTAIKKEVALRSPRWQTLQRLLTHAESLSIAASVKPQAEAIKANRSLLTNPDPVPPLCSCLVDDLRTEVQTARDKHLNAYSDKIGDLEEDPVWQRLSEADQKQIRWQHGLTLLEALKVGTEAELLVTLDATPLKEWENKTAAISERIKAALLEAARRMEPKAERVTLPSASLKTEADVDAYLTKVRAAIMAHIADGRPVVI